MVLTRFRAIFGPKLAHFQGPLGLERGQNCATWAQNWAHSTSSCTGHIPRVALEEDIFDPFLTDYWSQNNPFSRHLCDGGGPELGCNGLKMGSFHLFRHPKWFGIIFGKTHV